MNVDTRLNLALELTLKPDSTYSLTSDAYCVEAGKRAVIGDDTGLGMISTMKAEGTYTVNEDGTVTTSAADHAVFTLELDTYSGQMRSPAITRSAMRKQRTAPMIPRNIPPCWTAPETPGR